MFCEGGSSYLREEDAQYYPKSQHHCTSNKLLQQVYVSILWERGEKTGMMESWIRSEVSVRERGIKN